MTTHHDVIEQWAEARGGIPATVEGTEHGDRVGVLRFDFGDDSASLRQVSWSGSRRSTRVAPQDRRPSASVSAWARRGSPRVWVETFVLNPPGTDAPSRSEKAKRA